MRAVSSLFALCLLPVSAVACSSRASDPGTQPPPVDANLNPLTSNGLVLTSEVFPGGNAGGNLEFVNVIAPDGASCAVQRLGSCLVQDCRTSSGTLQGVSAGQVDLDDGTAPVLTIVPAAPAMLYAEASAPSPWASGDSLQFVATGGDVPAFSLPFTAPGPITVSRPIMVAGTPVAIDPSMDLLFAWSGGNNGVTVEFWQTDAQADLATSLRILCEFEGPPGAAVVPSAVLSVLGTDTSLLNTLNVGGSSKVDTTLGGYWVHAAVLNMQSAQFTVK